MWTLIKVIDAILLIYFTVIAFAVPLLDAQTILPSSIFPQILINFKNWFTYDFGNYLLSEKPHFFIGIAWLELLFAWPLSIASIYAIVAGKNSLLTITCLTYGVYFFTALVAILSELMGSGKASKRLLFFYYIFLAFALLAILRGILPLVRNLSAYGTRPALVIKKRS